MNPEEFEEALLQYASEKGMKIVITKKECIRNLRWTEFPILLTGTFHVLVR